jgi:hypothetical protein
VAFVTFIETERIEIREQNHHIRTTSTNPTHADFCGTS